jgi:hypothetical protein
MPKDSIADLQAAVETVDVLQDKVLELTSLANILAEQLEHLEERVSSLEKLATRRGG